MKKKELLQYKEDMINIMDSVGYSIHTIKKYSGSISYYIKYLLDRKLDPNTDSALEFINYMILKKEKALNSSYHNHLWLYASKFLFFIENGFINSTVPTTAYKICGGWANEINNFIQDVLISKKKLSCNTIGDYIRSLKCFNQFIKEHDLELNEKTVYDFFLLIRDEEHNFSDYKMYYMKCHLKSFLAYLYKTQKTDNDLSKCVPDIKYKRNRTLPSVFTNDEIKKIIDQIDRNSIHGKRAYAMIILATRYGLRSGDVVNLKFENIDWEKNIISIEQKKTKCAIELPLLPEVGNAILDYLKQGRRESNLPYVFLNIKGPVTSITNGAFYNTLKYYINLAGIENLSKRKHGPHALRHSLASEMMNNGEELTTISAVLGHRSTQIT